jgi:hypothetical protein
MKGVHSTVGCLRLILRTYSQDSDKQLIARATHQKKTLADQRYVTQGFAFFPSFHMLAIITSSTRPLLPRAQQYSLPGVEHQKQRNIESPL